MASANAIDGHEEHAPYVTASPPVGDLQPARTICYICAMLSKNLAVLAMLLAVMQAQLSAHGQTNAGNRPATPQSSASTPPASSPGSLRVGGHPIGIGCDTMDF
jgi:hypothetical protein